MAPRTKWQPQIGEPVYVVERRKFRYQRMQSADNFHSGDCLWVTKPDKCKGLEWRRNCFATEAEAIAVCLESNAKNIQCIEKRLTAAKTRQHELIRKLESLTNQ